MITTGQGIAIVAKVGVGDTRVVGQFLGLDLLDDDTPVIRVDAGLVDGSVGVALSDVKRIEANS